MREKYMYLFGATLLALAGVGFSAPSVNAKSVHHNRVRVTRNYQRYFVNAPQSISSRARYVSGTASRGIRVTLQNGEKTVAKTYANRKTGRYTLRIPKRYRAGTQLKVMAQRGYDHPYKLVIVKEPFNQKVTVKNNRRSVKRLNRKAKPINKQVNKNNKKSFAKRNAKKVNQRNYGTWTNKITVKTPNGNWRTLESNQGYVQKWNLSQKRGLNETLYHNGRFVKKLITNAPYHVVSIKNNDWTLSYHVHGQKKTQRMTMRFLTNNDFIVTKQNGRRANLGFLR